MVIDSIKKVGFSKSTVDSCVVCSLTVEVNLVLCVQCSKWIHSRCAGVNSMVPRYLRNCDENIGEAMEQQKELCNEVETIRDCAR